MFLSKKNESVQSKSFLKNLDEVMHKYFYDKNIAFVDRNYLRQMFKYEKCGRIKEHASNNITDLWVVMQGK